MRIVTSLAYAVLLAAASPALADTITQDISFSGNQQNSGPNFVTGSLFNPALGTLTGVSADISGQYDASVYVPQPSSQTLTATLIGSLTAPNGQTITGSLGTFTLTDSANDFTGVEAFKVNVNLASLTALENYFSGSANPTDLLSEISLYTRIPCCIGASDDFSTYSGTFAITYTYEVPEPSSLLMVASVSAILILAMMCGMRLPGATSRLSIDAPPKGRHILRNESLP